MPLAIRAARGSRFDERRGTTAASSGPAGIFSDWVPKETCLISAAIPHYVRVLSTIVRLNVQPNGIALWKTEAGKPEIPLDPFGHTVYRAAWLMIHDI